MNLPSKDKHGNSYLSYTEISTFLEDREKYRKCYILKEPFEGNPYTDFGSKVDKAIQYNSFEGFEYCEKVILEKCVRLDEFQRRVTLNYDTFYILGFVDTNTNNLLRIIDHKTGGKAKESKYKEDEYTQLCLYSLGIRQETGITPEIGQINFIRRDGNPFRGETLTVAYEEPLLIDVDISEGRLKRVYRDTLIIAKEIEEFYKENQ